MSLGEGLTPLVPADPPGASERPGPGRPRDDCWLKLDYLQPTLSFKDRGAVTLVGAAVTAGKHSLVVDSSGNAGTAIAAYAARAGVAAEVFVPAATSAAKVAAMRRYGASVRMVDGTRADAGSAARERVAETGSCYASHIYQPLFTHGTKTLAFELWEQLGGRVPGTVVVPAGNGTVLLGMRIGFGELVAAGLVDRLPVLVAVQARRCAPLLDDGPIGPTAAEGIAIAAPPRRAQMLDALRDSGGAVVPASEEAIISARQDLARRGLDVEPTAAAVWGAWRDWEGRSSAAGPVVVVLGGAGLKSP